MIPLLGAAVARTVLVVVLLGAIGAFFVWALLRLAAVALAVFAPDAPVRTAAPRASDLYVVPEYGSCGVSFLITRRWAAGAIAVADFEQAKAVIDQRLARYLTSTRFPSPYHFRLRLAAEFHSPSDIAFVWLESPELLRYQVVHCKCMSAPTLAALPVRSVRPSDGYTPTEMRELLLRAFPA